MSSNALERCHVSFCDVKHENGDKKEFVADGGLLETLAPLWLWRRPGDDVKAKETAEVKHSPTPGMH